MAGGLFGRPFELNIKCIIFSIIIMALFLYKPMIKSNIILSFILFIIFVISYVVMAWYDYYYDCQTLPLKRGEKSFTGLFKPPMHSYKQKEKEKYIEDNKDSSKGKFIIYLSHIVFIVPLLLYIAIQKDKTNVMVYPILIVLSIFTALYHGVSIMHGSHNM
jgi:hypothetical protein